MAVKTRKKGKPIASKTKVKGLTKAKKKTVVSAGKVKKRPLKKNTEATSVSAVRTSKVRLKVTDGKKGKHIANGVKKTAKAGSAKAIAPKVAFRSTKKAKPTDWATVVAEEIADVRKEFKKALKAEVAAAFDICLSAMEQSANLMESRLVTVLGEMSNLVTGAKPNFKDGKLKTVISEDGKERTDFSYGRNGLVTSRTYRDGKLRFEIVHSRFGNPLTGKMFGPSGDVVKEFSYGPDGQVK